MLGRYKDKQQQDFLDRAGVKHLCTFDWPPADKKLENEYYKYPYRPMQFNVQQ